MAVDQTLLESVIHSGCWVLRFYRWTPATLSLGYFQPYASRETHSASIRCPVVRRSTGGGAIVHDQELTYSLCVPSRDRWSRRHQDLVVAVHTGLIQLLADKGVPCRLAERSDAECEEAFLCFQRRSAGDVLLGPSKIAGSAQRRVKNALLQHGSILLKRSDSAPELAGLQDLTGLPHDLSLIQPLRENLQSRFGVRWQPSQLSLAERRRASQLQGQVFEGSGWTGKR